MTTLPRTHHVFPLLAVACFPIDPLFSPEELSLPTLPSDPSGDDDGSSASGGDPTSGGAMCPAPDPVCQPEDCATEFDENCDGQPLCTGTAVKDRLLLTEGTANPVRIALALDHSGDIWLLASTIDDITLDGCKAGPGRFVARLDRDTLACTAIQPIAPEFEAVELAVDPDDCTAVLGGNLDPEGAPAVQRLTAALEPTSAPVTLGAGSTDLTALALDESDGDIYLAGACDDGLWLARMNATLEPVGTPTCKPALFFPHDIAARAGTIAVAGEHRGEVVLDDIVLADRAPEGTDADASFLVLSAATFPKVERGWSMGGAEADLTSAVAIGTDGQVYVTGYIMGTGIVPFTCDTPPCDDVPCVDGCVVTPSADLFAAVADGDQVHTLRIGTVETQSGLAIAVDGSAHPVFVGLDFYSTPGHAFYSKLRPGLIGDQPVLWEMSHDELQSGTIALAVDTRGGVIAGVNVASELWVRTWLP